MEEMLVNARSVLVLGGARSGKSAYAQSLAEGAASERLYLATGAKRETRKWRSGSRATRPSAARGWTTLEEPLELAEALRANARPGRAVLVDCLTLWLSNLMFAGRDVEAEIARLAETIGRPRRTGRLGLQRGRARAGAGDEARPRVPRLAGSCEPGGGKSLRRGRAGRGGPPDAPETRAALGVRLR